MDIESSFNEMSWHDAKITSFAINRESDFDTLEADLIINDKVNPKQGVIFFRNCVYIESKLYLAAKMMCADDISGASCFSNSGWMEGLRLENPYDDFSNLFHFQITFIPPGGVMNILAESFSVDLTV